jgi:hypothetical protein
VPIKIKRFSTVESGALKVFGPSKIEKFYYSHARPAQSLPTLSFSSHLSSTAAARTCCYRPRPPGLVSPNTVENRQLLSKITFFWQVSLIFYGYGSSKNVMFPLRSGYVQRFQQLNLVWCYSSVMTAMLFWSWDLARRSYLKRVLMWYIGIAAKQADTSRALLQESKQNKRTCASYLSKNRLDPFIRLAP